MSEGNEQRAVELLGNTLAWDNHACMPLRPGDYAFLDQLERVRDSGIDVVTLNIGFGPQALQDHVDVLDSFVAWIAAHNDCYVVAHNVADIDAARAQGRLAIVFDVEGMAPLDDADLGVVERLRQAGVGWMLIAYNRNNAAGGGCMDDDKGLTAHGRAILHEMNRVGMIVCCSHTGHRTARDVLESAEYPVIFSHSNASAIQEHARNIPDGLIKACAQTGGVVGVNGVGDFLGDGEDYSSLIVRHIDHMVELVGPDHVGISLDYVFDQQEVIDFINQYSETFPDEAGQGFTCRFAPPETFRGIVTGMLDLGYGDEDIAKIVGGNWYRVASQVWPTT